jgi:hypothetical protein
MREFKFACPVCGQHITADAGNSGAQVECPTCFKKLIVPQAPAADSPQLILTAAPADRPRPPQATPEPQIEIKRPGKGKLTGFAILTLALILLAAGAFIVVKKGGLKLPGRRAVPDQAQPPASAATVGAGWTLDLSKVTIPDKTAAGSVQGQAFALQRASLQGGTLSLRQGATWPPDLGFTVLLFARQAEDLSGKTVEISADRTPPMPRVILRWKDAGQPVNRTYHSGYALRIEFGQPAGGRMPGKIYLCLPDEEKSYVAGTFDAEIRKPPPPKRGSPTQPRTS